MIFKLVIAFLLIYFVLFVLFVVETIKLSRNSRPKMQDNCEIKFKDVKKVKTQNIYYIEGR